MPRPKALYLERINLVIDYVQQHLDRSFTLDELAQVAHFSSYHFHRIFMALTGETLAFFTNRLRLEKATKLLRYSSDSMTSIALKCGFSSSSTFSRAFKQYFQISPSEYKKNKLIENSKIRKELFPIFEYIIPMSQAELRQAFGVVLKKLPPRRVAFIRVQAAYDEGAVLKAFKKLVAWAQENNIFEKETIFGMSLDDPMVTPKAQYRYEACITLPKGFDFVSAYEISTMNLPATLYATTQVSGDLKMVATGTHYLFSHWLIESEYEPAHAHALEVFLDKEIVCDWSTFKLELCLPVEPMR